MPLEMTHLADPLVGVWLGNTLGAHLGSLAVLAALALFGLAGVIRAGRRSPATSARRR